MLHIFATVTHTHFLILILVMFLCISKQATLQLNF